MLSLNYSLLQPITRGKISNYNYTQFKSDTEGERKNMLNM